MLFIYTPSPLYFVFLPSYSVHMLLTQLYMIIIISMYFYVFKEGKKERDKQASNTCAYYVKLVIAGCLHLFLWMLYPSALLSSSHHNPVHTHILRCVII